MCLIIQPNKPRFSQIPNRKLCKPLNMSELRIFSYSLRQFSWFKTTQSLTELKSTLKTSNHRQSQKRNEMIRSSKERLVSIIIKYLPKNSRNRDKNDLRKNFSGNKIRILKEIDINIGEKVFFYLKWSDFY